jgi:hypothetical protein
LNLLLFDVDGVLVYDRAYRAGVIAVLDYFGSLLGRSSPVIDEIAIETFHAHGYTNEWDICPFGVGILLIETLARSSATRLVAAPPLEFLRQIRAVEQAREPFEQYLDQTDRGAGTPSARALAVLLSAADRLIGDEHNRRLAQACVRELLADPYDLANALTTQLFQEHVLGSTAYEETYGLRARFDLPSLLYTEDRPALLAAGKRTIDRLSQAGRAHVCVYTARPSLPPSDAPDRWTPRATGYSPEAELAVSLVDLLDYPLMAMGRMLWLAQQLDRPVETLTKPAPIQALAAIAAALTKREAASLTAAYRLAAHGELAEPFASLRGQPVDVWVVEDAVPGLHAARRAIDLLRTFDIDARLHGLGIATGGPKAAALQPWCEISVPDVNAAIEHLARVIAPR